MNKSLIFWAIIGVGWFAGGVACNSPTAAMCGCLALAVAQLHSKRSAGG